MNKKRLAPIKGISEVGGSLFDQGAAIDVYEEQDEDSYVLTLVPDKLSTEKKIKIQDILPEETIAPMSHTAYIEAGIGEAEFTQALESWKMKHPDVAITGIFPDNVSRTRVTYTYKE